MSDEHHDEHDHNPIFRKVFITLIGCTVLTVLVSFWDMGTAMNLIVGILIATFKGSLVAAFFMHLYWDGKIDKYFFIIALFPLVLFCILLVPPLFDIGLLSPP
ncbi:MAG: cytochrome C oxidase subunit IV family protein [Planctomycetota bacterium]|nr:cytochrome C oxidase subunit IV family protein [Planctomycetota bacterium]MDA1139870.1 cytochrome C oxidase subunit IV family protein [Planctomycetota bacterium]